jgi:hypothetical protein
MAMKNSHLWLTILVIGYFQPKVINPLIDTLLAKVGVSL